MKPRDKSITPDARGLVCPKCACRHFEVIYTRPSAGGKIVRRRACRHCGKRVTTWEYITGSSSR